MKFKTYKVKQGQYNGIVDSTITIPDNLKLISGGIGTVLHKDCHNYLGIIEGDIDEIDAGYKGLHIELTEFDKYVIITIHDIMFVEPYPYLYTKEELNKEFPLNKYYLFTWSKELRLLNIKKIVRINDEFDIDVLVVTNRDYKDKEDAHNLLTVKEELDTLLEDSFSFVDSVPLPTKVKEGYVAKRYWNTLIYNTLNKFDIEFGTTLVDINAAHEAFISENYEEANEYIKLKKVKFKYN